MKIYSNRKVVAYCKAGLWALKSATTVLSYSVSFILFGGQKPYRRALKPPPGNSAIYIKGTSTFERGGS